MKIYRLEIWAGTSEGNQTNDYHVTNWCYVALSNFFRDKTQLKKEEEKLLKAYNRLEKKYSKNGKFTGNCILKFFDDWHKYLSKKSYKWDGRWIYDTHGNMPEINEYTLK